jgi:hypothetical protein
MLRRFAYPLYDDTDAAGAGAPAGVADAPVESESLSDHESQFSPEAQRAEPETGDEPAERDETGKFKPRHRAASQRAAADDVEAINAQTKRIKDAEAKLGADIQKLPGESDRVYTLRRRAELLERQAAPAVAAAPAPKPAAAAPPPRQVQAIPSSFPAYADWNALAGNEEKDYEAYVDARADWRYAVQRAAERQSEAQETHARTHAEQTARYQQGVTVAKQKYADWETVVTADAAVTGVIIGAILASEHGAEISYYLGKHPDIRAELNAESQEFSPSAVAAMRRYLDSLIVAAQRPSQPSSRTAAGSTGAALALAPPPAPRPPTPVRTGSIQVADTEPDDDDMSLANHEKHFGRRRAR